MELWGKWKLFYRKYLYTKRTHFKNGFFFSKNILVYLGIGRLLDSLCWSTICAFRKQKIVSYECENENRKSKCLRKWLYMEAIMTKLIDMNLCYDEKPEYQDYKYRVDSKAKPEHNPESEKLKVVYF